MTEHPNRSLAGMQPPGRGVQQYDNRGSANLADILERVLDKGIVIAGDISVSLVDVELLTIKIRLLVASVDRAKEMGIDWWEHDPMLSSRAKQDKELPAGESSEDRGELEDENERLRRRIAELEAGSAD